MHFSSLITIVTIVSLIKTVFANDLIVFEPYTKYLSIGREANLQFQIPDSNFKPELHSLSIKVLDSDNEVPEYSDIYADIILKNNSLGMVTLKVNVVLEDVTHVKVCMYQRTPSWIWRTLGEDYSLKHLGCSFFMPIRDHILSPKTTSDLKLHRWRTYSQQLASSIKSSLPSFGMSRALLLLRSTESCNQILFSHFMDFYDIFEQLWEELFVRAVVGNCIDLVNHMILKKPQLVNSIEKNTKLRVLSISLLFRAFPVSALLLDRGAIFDDKSRPEETAISLEYLQTTVISNPASHLNILCPRKSLSNEVLYGNYLCLRYILNGQSPTSLKRSKISNPSELLLIAITNGQSEIALRLLQKFPAKELKLERALFRAGMESQWTCANLLIQYGAETSSNDYFVFREAVLKNSIDTAELIFQKDVTVPQEVLNYGLKVAVSNANYKMTRLLIERLGNEAKMLPAILPCVKLSRNRDEKLINYLKQFNVSCLSIFE